MKIFNEENGVKKVYVQINDIMTLINTDLSIPGSVFEKVFSDFFIVNDSNRMDFVEFDKPNEIKYFESLDWIVDYKEIRDLTEEEIKNKVQDITSKVKRITNRYNSMSENQKYRNHSLVQKHELLDHKINNLVEVLCVKQGLEQIPFPIVPDSDGFSFKGAENSKYEIRDSLDPNKILLYRKDGKKLSNEDKIPKGFLGTGISIAANDKNTCTHEYEINNYLTEDKKYLVIEFKSNSNKNINEKEEKQRVDEAVEENKKEKGIKKLVKRFINRNKK